MTSPSKRRLARPRTAPTAMVGEVGRCTRCPHLTYTLDGGVEFCPCEDATCGHRGGLLVRR